MNDFLYNSGVRIIMRYAIAENLNRTESENLNGNHIFAGGLARFCDIIDSIQIEERGMF